MLGLLESEEKMVINIPGKTASVRDIVFYYLHSDNYKRLSAKSQREYATQLEKALDTVVEGKPLGSYRARSLKAGS